VEYPTNSLVFMKVQQIKNGLSKKLAPKWKGPYIVIKQLHEGNLILSDPKTDQELRVNVKNVIKFKERYQKAKIDQVGTVIEEISEDEQEIVPSELENPLDEQKIVDIAEPSLRSSKTREISKPPTPPSCLQEKLGRRRLVLQGSKHNWGGKLVFYGPY